uniref:MARVEL domain-containing protein n=1 Tax=Arion vulgaris TaxID=1028688 RepID=A0A0B6Z7X6_9EUPU
MSFSYSYPYDLESVCFGLPICGGGGGNISSGGDAAGSGSFCLLSGSEGASQFYVFVGVLVFLYCLAALVVYVVLDDMYKRNSRIIIADLIISIFLTLLWIISSSVWASGVADIKTYTDPTDGGIFGPGSKVVDCHKTENCSTDSLGNFASLNVSVIFGFLNFLVWLGNLWFIYKETPWFKIQAKPSAQPGTVSETDPQKV